MASVEQHRVASTASVVSPSARGIGIDTRRDPSPAMKAFYVVASIFLPPVAVAVRTGDPCETIISCGWLLCGWIPAIVHSVMVSFGDTRCSCAPQNAIMAVPPGCVVTVDNIFFSPPRPRASYSNPATPPPRHPATPLLVFPRPLSQRIDEALRVQRPPAPVADAATHAHAS